jgi:hypothetical protein
VFVVKDNQPGLEVDIAAGFGFEAAARSIAAAFSPRRAAAPPERVPGGSEAGRGDDGRGAKRKSTGINPWVSSWAYRRAAVAGAGACKPVVAWIPRPSSALSMASLKPTALTLWVCPDLPWAGMA